MIMQILNLCLLIMSLADILENYFYGKTHQVNSEDKTYIALFLLQKLLNPNKFQKYIWSISTRILHYRSQRINKLLVFAQFFVSASARLLLQIFSKTYSNRIEEYFMPWLLYICFTIIMLITFGIIDTYLALGVTLYVTFFMKFLLVTLLSFLLFFSLIVLIMVIRKTVLPFLWIDICQELNCDVKDVYTALDGDLKNYQDYVDTKDPVGIFTPQKLNEEYCRMISEESLREIIIEPNTSNGNIKIAVWVLASRHSEFGKILFSRDFDGKMPPIDPCLTISKKRIEKVAKKLNLSSDEMAKEFQSLDDYLGWDLRKGLKIKQDNE